MKGKSRLYSAIAALAFAHLPLAASAETRIIMEPFSSATDANAFAFQNHTTATVFFRPGETITVPRQSESFFWIYQHGLDLTPVSYSDNSKHVRAEEFMRVSGKTSRVFLPLVGNTSGPAGGIAVRVNSDRNTPVGEVSEVRVSWPLGSVAFKIRAACAATSSEDPSPLESAVPSASFVQAGTQVSLRLKLAGQPACGGQPLLVQMPACLTTRLTNANWEADDGDTIELAVQAAPGDDGRCTSGARNIDVTSGGVTKSVPIRYVVPAGPFKIPGKLQPAGPLPKPTLQRPGSTIVTPKPKPISP
ncbi:MAG: hypothetical protein NT117_02785 [Gammaproteobacteria bacterium]|nr:hypothetical protein [Gammaproteobacteria bacterium]